MCFLGLRMNEIKECSRMNLRNLLMRFKVFTKKLVQCIQGVQVDRMETDITVEVKSSPGLESEEFCALLRQQKYLNNLTEHALRKNQPLIISNLMHEKTSLLIAEGLSGTPKLEQMCLQALSICLFPGSSPVEISLDNVEDIDQEACTFIGKDSTTPTSTVIATPEIDLRKLVSCLFTF